MPSESYTNDVPAPPGEEAQLKHFALIDRLEGIQQKLSSQQEVPERAVQKLFPDGLANRPVAERSEAPPALTEQQRLQASVMTLAAVVDPEITPKYLGKDESVSPEAAAQANFNDVAMSIVQGTPPKDELKPLIFEAKERAAKVLSGYGSDKQRELLVRGVQAMNNFCGEKHSPLGAATLTDSMLSSLDSLGPAPAADAQLGAQERRLAEGNIAFENVRIQSLEAQKRVLSAVVSGGKELLSLSGNAGEQRELTNLIVSAGVLENTYDKLKTQGPEAVNAFKKSLADPKTSPMAKLTESIASSPSYTMRKLYSKSPDALTEALLKSEDALGKTSERVSLDIGRKVSKENVEKAQAQKEKELELKKKGPAKEEKKKPPVRQMADEQKRRMVAPARM